MLRLLSSVLVVIAAACTSAPAAPADSAASPTLAQASAGGVRTATPALTRTGTVSPPSMATPAPAGSTDVLLRMHHTGGHLFPGTSLDVAPTFTLYADGSVIYRPSIVPLTGPGGEGGGLRAATMNAEQMDALLRFALGPGGLSEAEESYTDVAMADGATTNFTIEALGVAKQVAVYALGDELDPTPEMAHRERFKVLADLLDSFEEEIERGNAVDAGPFEPVGYKVTLIPDQFGEVPPSDEWPWPHLDPADFQQDRSGFGIGVITPQEAQPMFALAVGEIGDPVVLGPDGVIYLIRYRPLLPDEVE